MRIHDSKPLFAWDSLPDSPDIQTIPDFLQSIPDERLLVGLRAARGKGRDDYPVRVLWGTLLLSIGLRHPSMEACLAELRRNAQLRQLFEIPTEKQVPNSWNMSRFLELLGCEPHRTKARRIFDLLIQRLGKDVPDLGQNTAGDSTTLNARRTAADVKSQEAQGQRGVVLDKHGLSIAAGGRKEYRDDSGQVTKVL
jgi:hypothetical protein